MNASIEDADRTDSTGGSVSGDLTLTGDTKIRTDGRGDRDKLLRLGKIDDLVYDRSIRKRLQPVWVREEMPEDISSLDGDDLFFLLRSVSRISFSTTKGLCGRLAILHAVNTLAAKGAYPRTAGVSIMLPEGTMESELRGIMDQICETSAEEEIRIAQVRCEITKAVTTPVVQAVCLGDPTDEKREFFSRKDIPGCHLLLTHWIGLEGTAVLGIRREKELLDRFPAQMVERCRDALNHLSIRKDARLLNAFSERSSMVALGEGGVYAALWYLGVQWHCGLNVDLKAIPILQETVEVCNYFDIDPYQMWSTGSLLAAVPEDNVPEILEALRRQGIPAADIGILTEGNDRIVTNGSDVRHLDRTQPDELLRMEDL